MFRVILINLSHYKGRNYVPERIVTMKTATSQCESPVRVRAVYKVYRAMLMSLFSVRELIGTSEGPRFFLCLVTSRPVCKGPGTATKLTVIFGNAECRDQTD